MKGGEGEMVSDKGRSFKSQELMGAPQRWYLLCSSRISDMIPGRLRICSPETGPASGRGLSARSALEDMLSSSAELPLSSGSWAAFRPS